ncbi:MULTISPECIES: hypothetical protein [unclassified Streptomyces]|uniref:hypothetical protein n=1 Tax=Streptomyces TaxID=1883 RepID=UPI003789C8BD
MGITTFPDWEHFLRSTNVSIRTTSGREVTVDELVQSMTATTDEGGPLHKRFRSADERRYVTSGGDCFCRYDFF